MFGKSRQRTRRKKAFHHFPATLGFDLLLTCAILGLGFMSVLQFVVRQMRPSVDYVWTHSKLLRKEATDLEKLEPAPSVPHWDAIRQLLSRMPTVPPSEDQIRRLLEAAAVLRLNDEAMGRLGKAHDRIWGARLQQLAQTLRSFWEMRERELCVQERPVPPDPPDSADPSQLMIYLDQLTAFGERVWELYLLCQEKTVVIGEDLLHFKVDRDDKFESDPTRGFRIINSYLDANVRTHPNVYIVGHTDETAGDEYNEKLSYRRASFVATKTRQYLRGIGLKEGRDFVLYPVGMGEKQPVKPVAGESRADFLRRCRRIEIQFRSGVGAKREGATR